MKNTTERRKHLPSLLEQGFTERDIAKMFGVSRPAISQDKRILGLKSSGSKKNQDEINQALRNIQSGNCDLWHLAMFGHKKRLQK